MTLTTVILLAAPCSILAALAVLIAADMLAHVRRRRSAREVADQPVAAEHAEPHAVEPCTRATCPTACEIEPCRQDAARAVRAAADDTLPVVFAPRPWPANTLPTPAEWAAWFTACTPEARVLIAADVLTNAAAATDCFTRNHAALTDRVNHLQRRIVALTMDTDDDGAEDAT